MEMNLEPNDTHTHKHSLPAEDADVCVTEFQVLRFLSAWLDYESKYVGHICVYCLFPRGYYCSCDGFKCRKSFSNKEQNMALRFKTK